MRCYHILLQSEMFNPLFPNVSIIVTKGNPGDSPVRPFAQGNTYWMI